MEPQVPKSELISRKLIEFRDKIDKCTRTIDDTSNPDFIRLIKRAERDELFQMLEELIQYIREHRQEL